MFLSLFTCWNGVDAIFAFWIFNFRLYLFLIFWGFSGKSKRVLSDDEYPKK